MQAIAFAKMMSVFGMLALTFMPVSAQTVEGIVPAGSRPPMPGPSSNFTGSVSVRPVVDAKQMGSTTLGEVTFQPGARSNWHTHPGGQSLYVTKGCGWTQREGGPIVRICEGDTAFVPAGVRHWHGATAMSPMTHLSITENVGTNNVNWMEPVTDVQYGEGAKLAR
jgi:quercetin dioxygenase-like cupin family protein